MREPKDKRSRLLSEEIFEELEKRVIDHVYPPGSHLVEDQIAESLGVSRTPVREAFRALERAGWVEIHPHSGAYVRHSTLEGVRDLFELRQLLEEQAARVAAHRITPVQIRTLERICDRGRKAVDRGSANKVLASLNTSFHEEIATATANQMLFETLRGVHKHVRWHFEAIADRRGAASWLEHEAILDAIVHGDSDKAGALMVEHSQRTQEIFLGFLTIRHKRNPPRKSG